MCLQSSVIIAYTRAFLLFRLLPLPRQGPGKNIRPVALFTITINDRRFVFSNIDSVQ